MSDWCIRVAIRWGGLPSIFAILHSTRKESVPDCKRRKTMIRATGFCDSKIKLTDFAVEKLHIEAMEILLTTRK
ncbi:hypothetical protein G9A89_015343 [Geosiphon pyriformis]|nr:hypothetical protein G9A89_015343 [Geosiphon pyriformis]